ncbi:hypothetical protein RYX36_003129 [Vicia faba]
MYRHRPPPPQTIFYCHHTTRTTLIPFRPQHMGLQHRLRPFRILAVLVGDGRLGVISGTISTYESLKLRGYDVVVIPSQVPGIFMK